MDKFIFQVGVWACSALDAAGLDQLKEANCAGYDSQYQLGAWLLIGLVASFVVPAMARSTRDFFRTGSFKQRGQKE